MWGAYRGALSGCSRWARVAVAYRGERGNPNPDRRQYHGTHGRMGPTHRKEAFAKVWDS